MEAEIFESSPLASPLKGNADHIPIDARENPFIMEMNGKGLENVVKGIIHGNYPSLVVLSLLRNGGIIKRCGKSEEGGVPFQLGKMRGQGKETPP